MTRCTSLMQQLWFIIISSLYMFRTSICPSSWVFCIQVVYCWTPYAAVNNLYTKNSWRWTYRCPKHVEATYDNKSQLLHQVGTSRHFSYMMHGHTYIKWLLFIHKILFSSTCFEPQVLIFRRIQLYTCSIWYCHSLWELVVACRYTAWVRRRECRGE